MSDTAGASPTAVATARPGLVQRWLVPVGIILVGIVLLFLVLSHWNLWRVSADGQHTNDAYIHADIVPLSTRVTGTLRELHVADYQQVKAGQLIAQLDDTDHRADLEQAEAGLAAARAAYADNQVQKQVQAAKIAQAKQQWQEAIEAEHAANEQVAATAASSNRAAKERTRQEALFAEQAATRQTLEKVTADDEGSRASLNSAHAGVSKAGAAVAAAQAAVTAGEEDLRLIAAKDRDLDAQIRQRQAQIKAAQVQLDYTQIHAPVDGMVSERRIFPGQLVSAGSEVIALVEGGLWVQANFQETQLGDMRPGDSADVRIDAVPGVTFHGKVLDFAPASGSQTALLPPDNATGNFTKVVQRIPVKIVLTDGDRELGRLRPGFSCDVTVHASGAR